MINKQIFATLLISVFILSCNQKNNTSSNHTEIQSKNINSKATEEGTVISADEYNELATNENNNGKRFAIIGYPNITTFIEPKHIGENNDIMPSRITFYEQPDGKGKKIGLFPIFHGKDKNQFEQSEPFEKGMVIFHDNNRNKLTQVEPMKISFTMDLLVSVGKRKIQGKEVFDGGPVDIRIDKGL